MNTKSKVKITIIFPDKNVYEKIYKIECEDNSIFSISRRYAHYLIKKVYKKLYPNASYSDFLDYCGECTVYIKKVV